MSDPVGFANRRLEKLNESMLALMRENKELRRKLSGRNDPLVAKVRKLEAALETTFAREVAREHLIKDLSENAEKQVRIKDSEATNQVEASL